MKSVGSQAHVGRNRGRTWVGSILCVWLLVATTVGRADDTTDERAYLSGNGLLNRELYDLAAAEYRKFLTEHADHAKAPVARYGLAVSLFRLNRLEEAATELTVLYEDEQGERFPYAVEVATILGQCDLALGRYRDAARAFAKVVKGHKGHDLADDAHAGWVEALYRAGNYKQAVQKAERFNKRYRASSSAELRERVVFFRGLALVGLSDHAAAAKQFEALLSRRAEGSFVEHASLLLAQCYHRESLWDKAAQQYKAVLKKGKSRFTPEALLGMAQLASAQNKPAEAGSLLDQLLKRYSDSPLAPSAHLQRGRTWFDLGRYDRALQSFSRVSPDREDLRDDVAYWTGKCKLRQEAYADAASQLARAIDRFPQSELIAEMHYDRAFALIQSRRFEDAIEQLDKFRVVAPDHAMAADALQLLATAEHQLEHYDRSQDFCRVFLKSYSSHRLRPVVVFLAAENEFLSGRYERAVDGYRLTLSLDPSEEQADRARLRLGMALYRLERFDQARPVLAEVVAKAIPESDQAGESRGRQPVTGLRFHRPAVRALGDIHFRRGEWADAETLFELYLGGWEDVAKAVRGAEKAKPKANANAEANSAGSRGAVLGDVLMKLGLARQRRERFTEALRAYDELLACYPGSPHSLQARFERGQVLVALDRADEAEVVFQEVLADGGDSRFAPYAENHLGSIALERGAFAAAAEHFGRATGGSAAASVESQAAMQRGLALMADERYGEAEKAFRRFLKDHADSPRVMEARARQAVAVSRQNRFADALHLIERVEKDLSTLSPSKPGGAIIAPALVHSLLYEKAWCLRKLDRMEEAAAAYRALLQESGDKTLAAHAFLELAGIESESDRHEAALPLLCELQLLSQDAGSGIAADLREQGLYRLGVCRFRLEQFELSVESFERFLKQFPNSPLEPSARLFCGEALVKLGRHERSIAHFERIVSLHDPSSAKTESSAGAKPSEEVFQPSLLRLAEALSVLQRWAASERVFRDYLDRFPESESWYLAQFGVAWSAENQGRLDEAIQAYEVVIERHRGPTAARAQFQIGECLFAQNKYKEAVAELLKVDILYAYPQWSSAAVFEAGRCFERLKQLGQARKQFQSVVNRYQNSHWARMADERLTHLAQSNALPGRP